MKIVLKEGKYLHFEKRTNIVKLKCVFFFQKLWLNTTFIIPEVW